MKLKFTIAATAFLSATTAFASPVSLTYTGPSVDFRTVTIDETPDYLTVSGGPNVLAGTFEMTDSTPNGLGSFFAWCLDLGAFLGSRDVAYDYEITNEPFSNSVNLVSAGMDRIADVFNANYNESITESSDQSAAFQLALWESVYDTDQNIGTGSFRASASDVIEELAQDYLDAAVGHGAGPELWNVLFLESTPPAGVDGENVGRQQNLVTVAPVPLPASVLMLLAALGAMGMTARRRQTA